MTYSFLIDDVQDVKVLVQTPTGQDPAYILQLKGEDQSDGVTKTETFSLSNLYVSIRIKKAAGSTQFVATVETGTQAPTSFDSLLSWRAAHEKVKVNVAKNDALKASCNVIVDDATILLEGQYHGYSLEDQILTIHVVFQSGSTFQYQIWTKKS